MSLDTFLPNYFVREIHHFAVGTTPAETFRTMCDMDIAEIPWVRGLFELRTFLSGHPSEQFRFRLKDVYKNGDAFQLLHESDCELTVGAVGKIWRPAIQYEKVPGSEFRDFQTPGFGKVAWTLKCEPRIEGGALGTFEVRVGATDPLSMGEMRTYYRLIAPFSRAIRRAAIGAVTLRLGDLFADEDSSELPGDSLIQDSIKVLTHSVTIDAPPQRIWPWLVQMGFRRAGWYSYDWLDNEGTPSASTILSQWQSLTIGDLIPLTPEPGVGFFVLDMQTPNYLILGGCFDKESGKTLPLTSEAQPQRFWRTTWSFALKPETAEVTRLIVRARADFAPQSDLRSRLYGLAMSHVHGFMERKQLQNLKRRVEEMHSPNQEQKHAIGSCAC